VLTFKKGVLSFKLRLPARFVLGKAELANLEDRAERHGYASRSWRWLGGFLSLTVRINADPS
jgi:hypothetical protein